MSSGKFDNLFVKGIKGKTVNLGGQLGPNNTVEELTQLYTDREGIPNEGLRFIFCTKQLERSWTLGQAHIHSGSTIIALMRLTGGSADDEEKRIDPNGGLQIYEDGEGADDVICKDKVGDRAKMPCGHVIGCASMTGYVRSVLVDKSNYEIKCPAITTDTKKCNYVWEWKHVRLVGSFTAAEEKEFDSALNTNYASEVFGMRNCPHCDTYIFKENSLGTNRVRCMVCKGADFCFGCLQPWTSSTKSCHICSQNLTKDVLLTCATKKLLGLSIPKIRMCPSCHTLIEHFEGCKHMKCTGCQKEFCWVCLGMKGKNGWTCGAHNNPCTLAPRQNPDNKI